MPKSNSMRLGYLGSVALIALAGAFSSAQASEYQFGEVSLTFDNNLSVGISDRVASRDMALVSEGNGGPKELRAGDPGSGVPPVDLTLPALCNPTCGLATGRFTVSNNPYAFPGSVNSDDGRLNYTSGDIIGAPVKLTSELSAVWRNYKAFVRGYGFYDFVLTDPNHGDRSAETADAKGLIGRDYRLLDAFISADYNFAGMPLNIRVGKQVINWGESTFLLNGLNNFNPIDVTAYRRPGAEIKDILLPVNAIEGSISLPYNVSLTGYYALGWDRYRLDPAGSPFSATDVVDAASGFGGNQNAVSFLSGSPLAGYRYNCEGTTSNPNDQVPGGLGTAQFLGILPQADGHYFTFGGIFNYAETAGINTPNAGVTRPNCNQGPGFFDYATKYTIGKYEQTSLGQAAIENGDGVDGNAYQGLVLRGQDQTPRKSGDFGINAKYLMDGGFLDGYEFGVYYQNYSSRLPFVDETTGALQLGIATTTNSANVAGNFAAGFQGGTSGRFAGGAGCGFLGSILDPTGANPALDAAVYGAILNPGILAFAGKSMADPQNLLNVNSVAQAYAFLGSTIQTDLHPGDFIDRSNGKTLFYEFNNTAGGIATGGQHDPNSIVNDAGSPGLYHLSAAAATAGFGKYNTINNAVSLNCGLTLLEAGKFSGLPMNFNGSEFLFAYNQLGLSLQYPEGIEQYGFSWAGTIGTWGIQGEFTYRPRAPFQADTDQLTIAAVTQECVFEASGNLTSLGFEELNTLLINGQRAHCDPTHAGNARINGEIFNSMYTGQVGSTATFTNSEWFIDAIGADLGIFVPEIGFVHVPGVESTWVDHNPLVAGTTPVGQYVGPSQYQNIGCQGSDLPLGGLLGLDHKSSKECRPTDTSAGLVLLMITQYNNAFDTGFVVSPQLGFSWDFYGTTPAPYGNYMEGRMAVNVGVNGSLNNNFTVGVNYTNYFGAGILNKSQDLDYVTASMGYSF